MKTSDGKFAIKLNSNVLDSDDAIVAVLAHEVHETRALEAEFDANGGRLMAKRVHSLVNAETGTLHCAAWDYADDLLRKSHGPREPVKPSSLLEMRQSAFTSAPTWSCGS